METQVIPTITPWDASVALFTFVSPNILALIQQPTWPTWVRRTTFAVFHLLIASVYLGAAGKFNGVNLSVAFSLIFTYGAASYVGMWKPLADKIEVKTTNATTKTLRKLGIARKAPLTASQQVINPNKDIMGNSFNE